MGKWGGGAWAIGDPSLNVKNFTNKNTAQGKGRDREAPTRQSRSTQEETGKICGFVWFSKRVLVNQKEQVYII